MMKNGSNNPSPCQVCGDIGSEEFIMTCFNCREVREHTYCAKVCLKTPPDMWICEVCRTSARLLHMNLDTKDLTTDHGGASSSKISSEGSSHTPPSKKHEPPFLAFPSPKRKPRTPRVPYDPEEADDQGPGSSYSSS